MRYPFQVVESGMGINIMDDSEEGGWMWMTESCLVGQIWAGGAGNRGRWDICGVEFELEKGGPAVIKMARRL